MRIKHSKYKNTGLIYELLVKQITSDLVARKNSPAVAILRRYYSGESELLQEYRLYRTVLDETSITSIKAESLINAALKASRKINHQKLSKLKYNLVSEIKSNYDLENFFAVPVAGYKSYAALYCLLEAERSVDLIDPKSIVDNRITLLEHMTSRQQSQEDITNALIQEFSSQEKDLRLLTFKILLEKFNSRYADLLPDQKNLLKHVVSLGSNRELRNFLNEEMKKILEEVLQVSTKLPKGIEKIKLMEAVKMLSPLSPTDKVTDSHLVRVLEFYELLEEIKKL